MTKCERVGDLVKSIPWLVPFEIARVLFIAVRAPGALRGYTSALPALPTAFRHRRTIQRTAKKRQAQRGTPS